LAFHQCKMLGYSSIAALLFRADADTGPASVRKRAHQGARGVRFGRPKKLTVHQRREAIERVSAGEAGHVPSLKPVLFSQPSGAAAALAAPKAL
jgi:hypothetical protein